MEEFNEEYWQSRWETGKTGWDIGYASPALVDFAKTFNDEEIKILIPGCGNGYEAEELHKLGYKNTHALDLAPGAFHSLQNRYPDFPEGNMILGDFFEFNGRFDLILEQTFFCAINPNLRRAYAQKMIELLEPGGTLAGLLFDAPLLTDHPPFGGSKEVYRPFFEDLFELKTFERSTKSIPPRAGKELFIQFVKPH
ncbi:MAG: TPMT family class I SAM-dependent methyltransferase [Flavobacteriales bacterium]|nr:TPMT family class I SAM-dependent methyltransferase [Flavobacteriales bacterium]